VKKKGNDQLYQRNRVRVAGLAGVENVSQLKCAALSDRRQNRKVDHMTKGGKRWKSLNLDLRRFLLEIYVERVPVKDEKQSARPVQWSSLGRVQGGGPRFASPPVSRGKGKEGVKVLAATDLILKGRRKR